MREKIADHVYFFYEKELEYLFVAEELMNPLQKNPVLAEIFAVPDQIQVQMLREVFDGFAEGVWEIILEPLFMEPVHFFIQKEFSIKAYREYLLGMEKSELLSKMLQIPESEIKEVLLRKELHVEFYQKHRELFQNYFTVDVLLEKTDWFLETYFELAESLRQEKAEKYLDEKAKLIEVWKKDLTSKLKEKEPLAVSEELMEKTFYNRGPYEEFYFMPSFFLPCMCCRFFEKSQILFFDAVRIRERKTEMPKQLKMLADPTRFSILKLLKQEGHLSGIEIAEKTGLVTSTVSHHMTQLKSCGLVHEEPAKGAKYFSLNQVEIGKCIEMLQDTFMK